VALIPIRSGEEIIGLLQLNDHRINAFSEELIPFFEGLSANIGIALMRNRAVFELGNLNVELERRVMERTQQLNDSNSELESFAYSISHDLRTPLRHIIAFSGILESELNADSDSEINRITLTIKNSAVRLSKLIDELLYYSLLGRSELKSELVSLQGIVNEVLSEAREVTTGRNIELKLGVLPDVEADKTLLYLVFQNLIGNALKFTQKKEKAIIEIYSDDTGSNDYRIFIKDNGAGFNMDYADKLFGVFKRLHSSEEFEGTGIGLATVRRILKRHGGTISAEGKVNEGAVFSFTLPKKYIQS
jgi:light-regulated signal transduction histidine kinase (bacteriophytochrome)